MNWLLLLLLYRKKHHHLLPLKASFPRRRRRRKKVILKVKFKDFFFFHTAEKWVGVKRSSIAQGPAICHASDVIFITVYSRERERKKKKKEKRERLIPNSLSFLELCRNKFALNETEACLKGRRNFCDKKMERRLDGWHAMNSIRFSLHGALWEEQQIS